MKLDDEFNQDEYLAKSWIEKHAGIVLWGGIAVIVIIAVWAIL